MDLSLSGGVLQNPENPPGYSLDVHTLASSPGLPSILESEIKAWGRGWQNYIEPSNPYSSCVYLQGYSYRVPAYSTVYIYVPLQGLTDEEVLEQQISSVACLKIPKSYPPEIKNIMKACWQQDASQRPSFLLIAKLITNLTVN